MMEYNFQSEIRYSILFVYTDGLAQESSNATANVLELLQSCTKPSIWFVKQNACHCSRYTQLPAQSHTPPHFPDNKGPRIDVD